MQQRNWNFDTYLAAKLEFQIILGNFNGSSFEVIQNLMIQLYTTDFACGLNPALAIIFQKYI